MDIQKPKTAGQLTRQEAEALESWFVVLIQEKGNEDMWHVGDIFTLQLAKVWNLDTHDVFNLHGNIACMDAQRRWAAESWFDQYKGYEGEDL